MALFELLSGILHLCDVRFVPVPGASADASQADDEAPLERAARLLCVPTLSTDLTSRTIRTGRDLVTVPMSATEAASARDALVKSIYGAIFGLLVTRVNETATSLSSAAHAASDHKAGVQKKQPAAKSLRRQHVEDMEEDGGGTTIVDSPQAARHPPTPGSGGAARGKQALNAKTDRALTAFGDGRTFIGLLDMFGFEIFEQNGLEQLCINFANEKLQQYFVRCVFKAEEEIHRLEGVPWPEDISYHDNQGCIDALTQSRSGVFRLLDESCALKSAAEAEWFRIVDQTLCVGSKAAESFVTGAGRYKLRDDEAFVVRHFAGDVCYSSATAQAKALGSAALGSVRRGSVRQAEAYGAASSDSWLNKNRDQLLPTLAVALAASESPLLASLFEREGILAQEELGSRKRPPPVTVARKFVAEVDALILDLQRTHTSFIRCVKPNSEMAPRALHTPTVLRQLRCLGMLEVVKALHCSYPTRLPYADLHGRYAANMPPILKELRPMDFAEAVAHACGVPAADFYLGATRLFLRGGAGTFLEELRHMDVERATPLLIERIELMQRRRAASSKLALRLITWHRRRIFLAHRRAARYVARTWRGTLSRRATERMRVEQSTAAAKAQRKRAADAAAAERESANQRAALADRAAKMAAVAATAAATRVAEMEADNEHRFRSATESGESGVEAMRAQAAVTAAKAREASTTALEAQADVAAAETVAQSQGRAGALSAVQLQAIQELRLRLGEPTRSGEGGNSEGSAPAPRARSRGLNDPSAHALQASLSRGLDGAPGIANPPTPTPTPTPTSSLAPTPTLAPTLAPNPSPSPPTSTLALTRHAGHRRRPIRGPPHCGHSRAWWARRAAGHAAARRHHPAHQRHGVRHHRAGARRAGRAHRPRADRGAAAAAARPRGAGLARARQPREPQCLRPGAQRRPSAAADLVEPLPLRAALRSPAADLERARGGG